MLTRLLDITVRSLRSWIDLADSSAQVETRNLCEVVIAQRLSLVRALMRQGAKTEVVCKGRHADQAESLQASWMLANTAAEEGARQIAAEFIELAESVLIDAYLEAATLTENVELASFLRDAATAAYCAADRLVECLAS